jgi:hypothetical protein
MTGQSQQSTSQQAYVRQMRSPLTFWWFLLWNLPTVLFWGVRVRHLDENRCQVTLPFNWRSKNPFRSIYFAALSGAAELASGALCMFYLQGAGQHSMLITGFEAEFIKKANQTITFNCDDGPLIKGLIKSLNQPGQSGNLKMLVTAVNENGELIANFKIHWSIKKKA